MKPEDLNDKVAWCEYGAALEDEFIERFGLDLGLTMNPGKEIGDSGKYLPDFFSYRYSVVADLKTVNKPFFTAGRYQCNPSTTVTIDVKDLFRYGSKYPNILVYFWVNWEQQEGFGVKVDAIDGIWVASLKTLFSLKPNIHVYESRKDDKKGNAKSSFVLDLSKLPERNKYK